MNHQHTGQVTVRRAGSADHPRIAALTIAAYQRDGQVWPGHPYERTLADVDSRAAAGDLLVAEDPDSGELLGSVLFVRAGSRYAELCGAAEGEFRMLAVDPAAQGRGVGAALVRACLHRAAELGLEAVVICSRDFAASALRLYQRLGFVRVPERDWTPMPDVRLLALRRELTDLGDG